MSEALFFGEWITQRRKALDLTQRELAARTNCALVTIKKIETGERRPSRELAEAIAGALQISASARGDFVECARGVRAADELRAISPVSSDQVRTAAPPVATDLPAYVTPLVGRTVELAQITKRLAQLACRLLTLVGPGGIGKSRLALEAVRVIGDRFTDGVAFISLTAVTDAALLPTSIGHSFQLGLSGLDEAQLFAYLRDKNMLLVLDNCEQLVGGISWLSQLLAAAPRIKLLATSRERLRLTEEWIFDVPVLDETHAVDLFVQTARRVNPQFECGDVSTICRLVENLPLALELAASWTPLLSCEQIAHNIQQNLDFLSANVRNMPERHRSIRAVFDQSWRLLTPTEQDVMMRLSVFRGGWTIDEAESVASGTLFTMRALVEKSLVRTHGQGRYDLHELIRQYAADQLRTAGNEAETRQRHAQVYLALAGLLDSQLHTSKGIAAFARLDEEQDNMRAGLSWALETNTMDTARQFADKLSLYWWRRGHWAEGERWMKAVDARSDEGDSPLLCWVLMDAAFFLVLQGRFAESVPYMTRAEAMALRLNDPETTMRRLIIQVQARSDIESAAAAFETFFSAANQVQVHSKSGLDAMIAAGYDIYGDRLRDVGRVEEAEAQYRQSINLWRRMGNLDAIAYPIGNLGRLALQAGRTQEAYERLSESVAIARAIGNRVGIADWLPHLGSALLSMGDVAQAEACYDETLALCEEMGNQIAHADVLTYLGYTLLVKGDVTRSQDCLRHSLISYRGRIETQQELGVDWMVLLPPEFLLCLRTIALLDMMDGQFEHALQLFSAAAAMQPKLVQGADLGMQARVNEAMHTLRSKLAQEKFAQAWEAGQSMSPEAMMAYALETP